MERNEAEEIRRAADQITEAVRELSSTLNRFVEYQEHRGGAEDFGWWTESGYRRRGELVLGFVGSGGLPEKEAMILALELKRRDEGSPARIAAEASDPTPEQVRGRRESRRAAEDSSR